MKKILALMSLILIIISVNAQNYGVSERQSGGVPNLEEIQSKIDAKAGVVDYTIVEFDQVQLKEQTNIEVEFADQYYTIYRDRLVERSATNYSWFGYNEEKTVEVVLAIDNEDIQGIISAPDAHFVVETFGTTKTIQRIDQSQVDDCGNRASDEYHTGVTEEVREEVERRALNRDCKIRILVLYTPAAYGLTNNMNNTLQAIEDITNNAFMNSDIYAEIEIVHSEWVDYEETTAVFYSPDRKENDLQRFYSNGDGYMDNVHTLRDQYDADVCALVNRSRTPGSVGMARTLRSTESHAFFQADLNASLTNFTFGHELAHIIGCQHHIGTSARVQNMTNDFPYAHGYIDGGANFRSIMGTPSGGGTRRNYFSNPNVTWGNTVTGNAIGNNALAITLNYDRVVHFRTTKEFLMVEQPDVQSMQDVIHGGSIFTNGNVVVPYGSDYMFNGEHYVELRSGFETDFNCDFLAVVDPCGVEDTAPKHFTNYKTFPFDNSTDHQEIDELISVYPIPTDDIIYIDNLSAENTDIKVFNLSGQQMHVKSRKESDKKAQLSLEGLSAGVYFLKVGNDATKKSYLIVKD